MKCQILFSVKNKTKYQFVVCGIYPEREKGYLHIRLNYRMEISDN